jgi:competence protein ComGF
LKLRDQCRRYLLLPLLLPLLRVRAVLSLLSLLSLSLSLSLLHHSDLVGGKTWFIFFNNDNNE